MVASGYAKRLLGSDALATAVLIILCVGYAYRFVPLSSLPFEDAAILMRYAVHLAQGHGIVWNVGEPPVDGATDFLFLVVMASLIRLGMSAEMAARAIGFVSHLLSVVLVYYANRSLWQMPKWIAVFCALYLMVGPGLAYVSAHFGTPFFALAALVAWILALRIAEKGPRHALCAASAAMGLVTALIRPEGAILATLITATIILSQGVKRAKLPLLYFVFTFLVVGGLYFLWRWDYFGHPLPNPFYKKGGGLLYPDSLLSSLNNVLQLGSVFLLAFPFALHSQSTTRRMVAYAIPILGFATSFILISDEMNFKARFQYVLLPLLLTCWYPLVRDYIYFFRIDALSGRQKAALLSGMTFLALVSLYLFSGRSRAAGFQCDGRYDIAKQLAAFSEKRYIMAVSEAGLLPFYSKWTAVDTWGLNDHWIATSGGITESYLDRYRPHVIMFHARFSCFIPPDVERGLGDKRRKIAWTQMTLLLQRYAKSRNYILAAAYGDSPYSVHYYYVRPDFSDSRAIVAIIKNTEYRYYATGRIAINYAELQLERVN